MAFTKQLNLTKPRHFFALAIGWALIVSVSASAFSQTEEPQIQESKNTSAQDAPQEQGKSGIPRPKLFDAPMDFSEPPVVAKIDGPSPSEIQVAIDRGARFLISSQNPDGSFGSHVSKRIGEIYAPLPSKNGSIRYPTRAQVPFIPLFNPRERKKDTNVSACGPIALITCRELPTSASCPTWGSLLPAW